MSITIPDTDNNVAGVETQDFTHVPLYSGDQDVVTTTETVADATVAAADLPENSVVGRDANGQLVMAVYDAGTPANMVYPIGITARKVAMGSTGVTVPVYRQGFFNPDALNWDASFNTDEIKRLAFEMKQPNLFIRKYGYS